MRIFAARNGQVCRSHTLLRDVGVQARSTPSATDGPTISRNCSDELTLAVVDTLGHLCAVQAQKDHFHGHCRTEPLENLSADVTPRSGCGG